MPGTRRQQLSVLAAGVCLAVVAGLLPLARPVTAANDVAEAPIPAPALAAVIDPVTTATVPSRPPPAAPTDTQKPVSEGFLAGLALLNDGDPEGAFAAAAALSDDVERLTLQWASIQYGSGRIAYDAVKSFSEAAPDFVTPLFSTRLEQSILRLEVPGNRLIELLGETTPSTIEGRIALAAAYLAAGDRDRAASIARPLWVEEFLDQNLERKVLADLGNLLTAEDHWNRAVHLMMHDRASGVERLTEHFTPAQASLAIARNAVSRNADNAKALLDAVDPAMQAHPVYLFSRFQRARQFELWEDAVEWANKATGALPDAGEWWYERRTLVRSLLAVGKPDLAYRAAAGYREGPEGRLVEAHFHAGWIALSFLDDAASAVAQFQEMRKHATLPDTITQANFWLGRALLRVGDVEAAKAAFETAAQHGTVYYGLLARAELGLPGAGLVNQLDADAYRPAFEARDVVGGIRLLVRTGETTRARVLLSSFAHLLTAGPDLALAAHLAQEIGAHDLAISIADSAEELGYPLHLVSFPDNGMPTNHLAAIDHAAVLAIARQESRFRADAQSSAGALGLMQLMPGTARETAAKVGVPYSASRLTSDPAYNALLGSTYLAAQLDRYDNSLVLAAAAYNAGAGNANKWLGMFGDPRAENVDPVVWVELIPFLETRKYVQRVLGNYLVYRARLGDTDMTIYEALRKIPR